jgi:acyl transferase domain-containing protein
VTGAEDVAIVGMACRLPGADGVDELWSGLLTGRGAIRTYTEAELREAGIGEDRLRDPGYVRAAGHLDGFDRFDADFFGYTARQVELLDPQHRMFLEVAWAALEDAGHDPEREPGITTGVFAGAGLNRYFLFNLFGNPRAGLGASPDDLEGQLAPGIASDHLPMRVSHRLGLTGPSVAVQTACSTSLVAVCLAAQSLRDFRCDMAIAGGASLAATRPCGYPVEAGAPPGSGAAAVVLRRLEDAVAGGDHVHAVIRGWAVNNDGAGRAGYEVPGAGGQAAVVVEALSAADVDPGTVGYVEAHAGGTPVGDAIEIDALTRAFRRRTRRTGYCALGSVKAGLGNLDAAGGAAGLIQAALAVRHGVIPPCRWPGDDVDLAGGPFVACREAAPWAADGPRRAGVSSFGLGGTNAHVVLEEASARAPSGPSGGERTLALSARTPAALAIAAARLRACLAERPELALGDVAYTLAVGRRAFAHRWAVTCRSIGEAVELLREGPPPQPSPHGGEGDPGEGVRVPLPTYPFERRRFWIERWSG